VEVRGVTVIDSCNIQRWRDEDRHRGGCRDRRVSVLDLCCVQWWRARVWLVRHPALVAPTVRSKKLATHQHKSTESSSTRIACPKVYSRYSKVVLPVKPRAGMKSNDPSVRLMVMLPSLEGTSRVMVVTMRVALVGDGPSFSKMLSLMSIVRFSL